MATRDEKVVALYSSDLTNAQIGERFGIRPNTVTGIFKRAALPPRRPGGITAKERDDG